MSGVKAVFILAQQGIILTIVVGELIKHILDDTPVKLSLFDTSFIDRKIVNQVLNSTLSKELGA